MDPKRKRIYIILIVFCVVASAGVFLWGRIGGGGGNPAAPLPPGSNPAPTLPAITSPGASGISAAGVYAPPAVFPVNKVLDTSVLDSSAFTTLQTYPPIQLNAGELGREDPFKNF